MFPDFLYKTCKHGPQLMYIFFHFSSLVLTFSFLFHIFLSTCIFITFSSHLHIFLLCLVFFSLFSDCCHFLSSIPSCVNVFFLFSLPSMCCPTSKTLARLHLFFCTSFCCSLCSGWNLQPWENQRIMRTTPQPPAPVKTETEPSRFVIKRPVRKR